MNGAARWLDGDASRRAELESAIEALEREDGVEWLRGRAARRGLARVALSDGRHCFLKHYRKPTRHAWREWWKRRLHLTTAEREWRTLVRLRRAGVPVPEPVAHLRLGSGEHILVTEWIAGIPLSEALATGPRRRRPLLSAVGSLVRALHDAAWVHRDLHRENILVTAQGPVLVDLQAALPTALSRARRRDLGELDHSLRRLLSQSDRLRLRAAALGVTRPFDRHAREQLRAVGRASLARARAHARSRAGRSLRAGRRARRLCAEGGTGLVARAADEAAIRAALHAAVPPPGIELRRYAAHWSELWRGSAARRAWYVAHALEACDVPRVAPLAFLEWRTLEVPRRSALFVEASGDDPPCRVPQHVDALVDLWIRLLEAGFRASRLDASGVALRLHAGRLEARVAAFEALRFPARLGTRERRAGLARLDAACRHVGASQALRERAVARYRRRLDPKPR